MGALDRLKTNRQGQVLIPNNVTGGEYQEGLNIKQAITLGGMALGTFIAVVVFKDSAMATVSGWIGFVIILLVIYQFLIRYVVIGENYLAKQTILLKQAQDKVPADLWNIINIDDDGIIYYQDGRLGLIICAEQATIVGRSASYKSIHYSALSDFYKTLNNNGVYWMHINAMVNARTENRLSMIHERLRQANNKAIRKACESHLAYLRGLEVRTLYEKEYWRLTVGSSYGKDRLLNVTQQAAEHLQTAAFNRYDILPREECYELCCQLLNLNSFDAQSIMIEKAQRIISTPLGVIKQVRFNTELNEERVATIQKTLGLFKDKSEFKQLTDSTFVVYLGTTLANMLTQRLRILIQDKRQIETGYVRSNCFNIKWQDGVSTDIPISATQEEDEVFDLGGPTEATLFGAQFTNVETTEDLEQQIAAQSAETDQLNLQIFSEAELARKTQQAEKTQSLKTAREERLAKQKQEQEEQEKREAERRAAAEFEAKKRVTVDDFGADDND